jgi:hypothetical protein
MDEPWDTSLTYSDAQEDLPEIDEADRDRAVGDVLLQLYDEGLVCFFEIGDFGESYSRTPTEEEKLSREALVRAVGADRVGVPQLGLRATLKGRDLHFTLFPDDRRRAEAPR